MKSEALIAILRKHPGTEVLLAYDSLSADADPVGEVSVAYIEGGARNPGDSLELFEEDEVRDEEDPSAPIIPIFKKVVVIKGA